MTTLPPSQRQKQQTPVLPGFWREIGAGNEARTRDLNLGKVALYQLSYSRPKQTRNCRAEPPGVKKLAMHAGSPLENAARIKVPVLFHGAFDRNVGIEQFKRMAARLTPAGATWGNLDHQLDDSSARAQMLAKSDAFLRAAMVMQPN
jgi:hypothetical protein